MPNMKYLSSTVQKKWPILKLFHRQTDTHTGYPSSLIPFPSSKVDRCTDTQGYHYKVPIAEARTIMDIAYINIITDSLTKRGKIISLWIHHPRPGWYINGAKLEDMQRIHYNYCISGIFLCWNFREVMNTAKIKPHKMSWYKVLADTKPFQDLTINVLPLMLAEMAGDETERNLKRFRMKHINMCDQTERNLKRFRIKHMNMCVYIL